MQAYLREIVGSVPDHIDKAGITTKCITQNFQFSVPIKIMFTLYCCLLSALHQKKCTYLNLKKYSLARKC